MNVPLMYEVRFWRAPEDATAARPESTLSTKVEGDLVQGTFSRVVC